MRRHAKAIAAAVSALLLLGVALGSTLATAAAPSVTIDAPSSISYTSVHLSGTINPNGGPSPITYYLEYRPVGAESWTYTEGGQITGAEAESTDPVAVGGDITGLAPGTEYELRLDAYVDGVETYSAEPHPTFTTLAVPAPSVSISAPSAISGESAHFSGTIDPEAPSGNPAAFDVTWRFECTPNCPGLTGGTIPADSDPHTVEADTTGLIPGTAYEVTLIASNAGGQTSAGPESFSAATQAPQVKSQSASVGATSATLTASINPGALATTYHFEYGPTASYGQSTATKQVAAAGTPLTVKANLSGLTPAAGYHYRVVASNSAGAVEGADQSFTTSSSGNAADNCPNALVRTQQNARGLADCRAYEMVSPLQKNNGDVRVDAVARAATDGNGLEYEALAPFAGAEGAGHLNQYVGWRSPTGWTTEALNPYLTPDFMAGPFPSEGYYELTHELTKGVLLAPHNPNDRSGDTSEDAKRLYLRVKGTPGVTPISPRPVAVDPLTFGPVYAGASTDMSRIFVEATEEQLISEAPPADIPGAYEWHDGQFTLIGRLPNGEVAPDGARIGSGAGVSGDSREAVSGDGTQVVLTMGSPGQLYLREGGQSQLISDSQVSGEEGTPAPNGATFIGSRSADGVKLSTIYFASPNALTGDAEADPSVFVANELYAYDVQSGELSFLSKRTNPSSASSAIVSPKWIAASKDGSHVYFVASGNLTPGSSGQEIYLWHDGVVMAIGSLENVPNGGARMSERNRARLSPDGRRLLLVTISPRFEAGLTPDAPPCLSGATPASPGCPEEVYLYDAPTNDWTCLSCNPSGPTAGNGLLKGQLIQGYAGLGGQNYRSNNLSRDGSRAFFEAAEALVPRDTNGTWDVYEWHEGQINLISSGRGEGSYFMDASPDGRDVFIATRERLVPEDTDNLVDAYDVRMGGGFLYTPPPPNCEGDACQATPGAAPASVSPASSLLAGAGNAKQRRKVRCVPARKAKKGAKSAKAAKQAKARCAKPHQTKTKHQTAAKSRGGKH